MDNLKIGHKIKKLRELKNLTQEHMANSIGITQGAYSRMELGETEITYSKLEKISEELGMKPEDVIAFNESVVFNVMNNQTGNGLVINKQTKAQLSYGELVADASQLPVPQKPKLKPFTEFNQIGKPSKRPDVPSKVDGTAIFGMDVQLPGMLYASIIHSLGLYKYG